MAECKRLRARLVVAKLDRLTRNLHFLTGLIDSKIDFVAVDNPHANKLTLHILGAVAGVGKGRYQRQNNGGTGCRSGARPQTWWRG
jgi:hypothetical protein